VIRRDVEITPMRKGGFRVACHRCGWWVDEWLRPKATTIAEVHWRGCT
jgi:hypothetical protein